MRTVLLCLLLAGCAQRQVIVKEPVSVVDEKTYGDGYLLGYSAYEKYDTDRANFDSMTYEHGYVQGWGDAQRNRPKRK